MKGSVKNWMMSHSSNGFSVRNQQNLATASAVWMHLAADMHERSAQIVVYCFCRSTSKHNTFNDGHHAREDSLIGG